jgi:uncharacterized protein YajQ (UPF0234 family)
MGGACQTVQTIIADLRVDRVAVAAQGVEIDRALLDKVAARAASIKAVSKKDQVRVATKVEADLAEIVAMIVATPKAGIKSASRGSGSQTHSGPAKPPPWL